VSNLRVGLSGCGRRGAEVIAQVRTHDHCDVVALHDPDALALRRLGDQSGIGSRSTEFAALLQTGIDFVVLAGPCGGRLEQVQAAAEQGVHCLLHAPMAPDATTAAAMVAACERAGVKLGVAVPAQGDPLLEQLRRMLADDWLGAPVLAQAIAADDAALLQPPPPGHWSHDPALAGNGVLLQLASGCVHLFSWLLGRQPLAVTAQASSGFSAMPQDSAVATALLRGGLHCTLAASHLTREESLTILGTDGAIRLDPVLLLLRGRRAFAGDVFDYPQAGAELRIDRAALAPAAAAQRVQSELHGRFGRWLDDRDDFPCPGDQAASDLRLLDALARSLASGRRETL
jgi:predicted dehydrogenase